METWGFEGRGYEMPGERFGLLGDLGGMDTSLRAMVLRVQDHTTLQTTSLGDEVKEILKNTKIEGKEVPEDREALINFIKANKTDGKLTAEQKERLGEIEKELGALKSEDEKALRSARSSNKDDAKKLLEKQLKTLGITSGSGETESPDSDEDKFPELREDKLRLARREIKAREEELDDVERRRDNRNMAENLTLGATAINIGAGLGGGGGQFVSSASSGPGGSSFGVASGSGGFGGFGVAPFGAPGGMLGIASPGGGSGAMGPGDVLFNIGAPMMTSGANGFGEEIRQQNRKLEALINFLLMQILSGNTDAITSALIAVSRKSKGTLILSSVGMISAMKQYDQQQAKISETFQNLQFDAGNPDSMAKFQHQSQNLSMQLNGIAVARQMLMNQMRDVLTMSEEIGNVEKSILDIVGQFKRHYSRFNV